MSARVPVCTASDLIRLREEYREMGRRCKDAKSAARGDKAAAFEGQARAYEACALDLNDLIEGRGHPSARRR